jgi:hypothetical protein
MGNVRMLRSLVHLQMSKQPPPKLFRKNTQLFSGLPLLTIGVSLFAEANNFFLGYEKSRVI